MSDRVELAYTHGGSCARMSFVRARAMIDARKNTVTMRTAFESDVFDRRPRHVSVDLLKVQTHTAQPCRGGKSSLKISSSKNDL